MSRTLMQLARAALVLVLLGSPALGGFDPGTCCVCSCQPGLCGQGSAGCEEVIENCTGATNSTMLCKIELRQNSTCSELPECAAAGRQAAPLVGPTAVAALTVLLGGYGMLRARAARRR